MLDRVRQRLLHDTVGDQIQARRYRLQPTVDVHVHRQPCGARAVYERIQLREAGCSRALQRVAAAVQHADDPPQLHQRVTARALDNPHRCARPFDIDARDAARAAALKHHHADVVRDHVVQLASHPVSLLGRGTTRAVLLGVREPCRARLELLRQRSARVERPPDRERQTTH